MKNSWIYLACLLFVVLSFKVISNEVVVFAVGEWPPYVSARNDNDKIAEVIVSEALKLEGVDVEYEYFPWKRSLERVEDGIYAGTFPWWSNEKRQVDFIINKEPVIGANEVFFHLKSTDFKWDSFDDLKNYKIGGNLSYSHVEQLESKGIKVDVAPKEELSFKKLLSGRIDALPADFIVGYDTINKLFSPAKISLFTNHPKPLRKGNLFMLISRNYPGSQEIADKLDRGLKKLKESGRYDEIIIEFLERK
ncbi:substrate-binding periplasmic protein [Psychromonas aquimarina]|uniref:substrate-binding periplasmic protein n=1 Tax=Psychromonas aquimarina TaxID=444919 RepID=UPI0004014D2E|nr:transporter substrate-binding domain-containing protein [Psychromonas aquimarina]